VISLLSSCAQNFKVDWFVGASCITVTARSAVRVHSISQKVSAFSWCMLARPSQKLQRNLLYMWLESSSVREALLSLRDRTTQCISRNRARCCIYVRRVAFEKPCYRRMTSKVVQGHWKWHKSTASHIVLPISNA